MIEYHQKTAAILLDGAILCQYPSSYSGFGPGLNNPAMETIPDVGPIPRGKWGIARWEATHGTKGPQVAILCPDGWDAHGRSDFLIHGDNRDGNNTASHGCIIAPRWVRDKLQASGQTKLIVL